MAEQVPQQAQSDQSINPNVAPNKETVAATDEFFENQQPSAAEPKAAEEASTPLSTTEEDEIPNLDDGSANSSVGHDYVRELQQEFEEQEEEGKI